MTKVQLTYDFPRPLSEALLAQVAAAHSKFGLSKLQLSPGLDRLTVEYDASRLTADQVESTLHGFGLPIQRQG